MDMDMMEEEWSVYWETMFIENQELDRAMCGFGLDEVTVNQNSCDSSSPEGTPPSSCPVPSNIHDSSSPEGTPSSSSFPVPRNIVMERRRRQLANDKLKALRNAVPMATISKFDKASIIKDAIDYIQLLHEQEKRMGEEIKELERATSDNYIKGEMPVVGADRWQDDELVLVSESKKKRRANSSVLASGSSPVNSSIQVTEIKVCHIGERTFSVSIICDKKRETTINVCELFESLNLKVIQATISSISRSLLHTLVVESEELNNTQLKELVKGGIAELNAEGNPIESMSF